MMRLMEARPTRLVMGMNRGVARPGEPKRGANMDGEEGWSRRRERKKRNKMEVP